MVETVFLMCVCINQEINKQLGVFLIKQKLLGFIIKRVTQSKCLRLVNGKYKLKSSQI